MASPRAIVLRLSACYALALSSISLTVAAAPLVGRELAPAPGLATLPVSLAVLATMLASFPASLLMGRIGRRNGLLVGTVIGSFGAAVATLGILRGDFVMFCIGSLGIGALNGFAQFYRFAAADVADVSWRPRAISWVLAGGVAAGILGPGLAVSAADLGTVRFAGSYASILVLYALSAFILAATPIPEPKPLPDAAPARPMGRIVRQRAFAAAVASGMVAYGAMSLLMTATPLSMTHAGHTVGRSSSVIQMHVVAMFAPSFFTGSLIARFGALRIQGIGLVALAGTAAAGMAGDGVVHFAVALILLGIGWNFLFVTGTTLLTALHEPSEKAKVQGLNDVLVFGTAAAGSFLAGVLQQSIGWARMAWVVLAIAAVGAVVLVMARAQVAKEEVPPTPQLP